MLKLNFELRFQTSEQTFFCRLEGEERLSHLKDDGQEYLLVYDKSRSYLGRIRLAKDHLPIELELDVEGSIDEQMRKLIFNWLLEPCDKTVSKLAETHEDFSLPSADISNYKLAYALSKLLHVTEDTDPLLSGLKGDEVTVKKFLLLRSIFFLD